jgi:antibiotic biosynthesis monooxygenase (ABM) superfamily enzyme
MSRAGGSSKVAVTRLDPRIWKARVFTTLAAWLVAFLVVMALLTLFADVLDSLPLAVRALVLSGVLVAVMVNLVMPALNVAVAHWVARSRDEPSDTPTGGLADPEVTREEGSP